jgi:type II secretory pathway component PulL
MTITVEAAKQTYEREAAEKYELLSPDEKKIIDAQVANLRRHFSSTGYKGIPNNTSLLGLLMKLGAFIAKHDVHPREAEND